MKPSSIHYDSDTKVYQPENGAVETKECRVHVVWFGRGMLNDVQGHPPEAQHARSLLRNISSVLWIVARNNQCGPFFNANWCTEFSIWLSSLISENRALDHYVIVWGHSEGILLARAVLEQWLETGRFFKRLIFVDSCSNEAILKQLLDRRSKFKVALHQQCYHPAYNRWLLSCNVDQLSYIRDSKLIAQYPPTIILALSNDTISPLVDKALFYNSLRSNGIQCKLIIVSANTHSLSPFCFDRTATQAFSKNISSILNGKSASTSLEVSTGKGYRRKFAGLSSLKKQTRHAVFSISALSSPVTNYCTSLVHREFFCPSLLCRLSYFIYLPPSYLRRNERICGGMHIAPNIVEPWHTGAYLAPKLERLMRDAVIPERAWVFPTHCYDRRVLITKIPNILSDITLAKFVLDDVCSNFKVLRAGWIIQGHCSEGPAALRLGLRYRSIFDRICLFAPRFHRESLTEYLRSSTNDLPCPLRVLVGSKDIVHNSQKHAKSYWRVHRYFGGDSRFKLLEGGDHEPARMLMHNCVAQFLYS